MLRARLPAVALSVLATLALLAAAVPVASAVSPAPAKKAKGLTALIVKQAHNPVLRALRSNHALKTDRTSGPPGSVSKPSRYSLLIVDGDNLGAKALAKRKELRRFSASGRWILAFDVRRPHFVKAIGRNTGFSARTGDNGASRAFLYRRIMRHGTPLVQMIDARKLVPTGTAKLSSKRRGLLMKREAARVAALVQKTVSAGADGSALAGASAQDEGRPAELLDTEYQFTATGSAVPPPGRWGAGSANSVVTVVPPPGSQTITWAITHTFDVYLDNDPHHPQGNEQIVTYSLDGEVTPKTAGQSFFQMYNPFDVAGSTNLERAWWTGSVGATVTPSVDDGTLHFAASEPQTPNSVTDYETGQEFKVGVSGSEKGAEISASYKVENKTTRTIPDWGVENQGAGNVMRWNFSSRGPCDARPGSYNDSGCFDVGAFKKGTPNLPNGLSLGQFQPHASARWATTSLLRGNAGQISFNVSTPIQIMDSVCKEWVALAIACDVNNRVVNRKIVGPPDQTYSFNVADVLPTPIESVKFNPPQANGSELQNVTGTVKLQRPAPIDTNVVIYSNSANAILGAPIEGGPGSQTTIAIAKGQSSGTFLVQTNDDKLDSGGHTYAAITAFLAEPTTVQLRVNSE
jgi:hypothetical protein